MLQMPHPRRRPMFVLLMLHLVVHLLLQPAQLEVIKESGDWQEYMWPSLQNQTISHFYAWKRDREYSLWFHLHTGSIQASHWGTLHAYLKICKSNHKFGWRYTQESWRGQSYSEFLCIWILKLFLQKAQPTNFRTMQRQISARLQCIAIHQNN